MLGGTRGLLVQGSQGLCIAKLIVPEKQGAEGERGSGEEGWSVAGTGAYGNCGLDYKNWLHRQIIRLVGRLLQNPFLNRKGCPR